MASLFIIGNGFDLAHGIKTNYNDFRKFLLEKYNCSEKEWIVIPESIIGNHGEELQSDTEVATLIAYLLDSVAPVDEEKLDFDWSELEKLLGEINIDECFDTVEEQYDGDGDRFYPWEYEAAESICANISLAIPRIEDFFSEWIQTVSLSDQRKQDFLELIDKNNDLFFTFNYTNTLEKLYQCAEENICHIHGVVDESNDFEAQDLILGHNGNKNYANDNSIPYEMGPALQSIYEDLRKDTLKQIALNSAFFEKIQNSHIDRIYAYGFSFSPVDLPYIAKICSILDTRNTVWYLNSFDKEKHEKYQEAIQHCGFKGTFEMYIVNN